MEKLDCEKCQKGSFHGGWNSVKLVTYKDKITIPQKLQKYVVKWYHEYLLHPRDWIKWKNYFPTLVLENH